MCPNCQAPVRPDADFCTSCGTPLNRPAVPTQQPFAQQAPTQQPFAQQAPTQQPFAQQAPTQQPYGQQAPTQQPFGQAAPGWQGQVQRSHPPFQFSLKRLGPTDLVIGVCCAVVFLSLFLPWFGYLSVTVSGMTAHGYLGISLVASLALIAYLVLRAGWDTLPVKLPIAHAPLLLIGTAVQLLFVVIAFLLKPSFLPSWEIGAYIGLIAAGVGCAVIAVPAIRSLQGTQR